MKDKLYVVQKHIRAKSAAEALKKERGVAVDEIFLDTKWRDNAKDGLADAVGFDTGGSRKREEEEE